MNEHKNPNWVATEFNTAGKPYMWKRATMNHQPNTPASRNEARYSFVCNAGCGVCAVKVSPFEYERTETLEGEHLGSKYQPQIVSACCGSAVHVYDNEADHWGAEVTLAAPGAAIDAREQEAGRPTLQMLHEMAYLLKLVPRGSSVPVQILDVLSKQFKAAMAVATECNPVLRLHTAAQAAYELLSSGTAVADKNYRVVTELAAALSTDKSGGA